MHEMKIPRLFKSLRSLAVLLVLSGVALFWIQVRALKSGDFSKVAEIRKVKEEKQARRAASAPKPKGLFGEPVADRKSVV